MMDDKTKRRLWKSMRAWLDCLFDHGDHDFDASGSCRRCRAPRGGKTILDVLRETARATLHDAIDKTFTQGQN